MAYMELRNICLIEPETDELVQVSYLCNLDSTISENTFLDTYGCIRNIGMANDKTFMQLGIYPVAVYYERDGKTVRARENSMDDFEYISDNIYKPNQNGLNMLCRLQRKKAS